MNCSEIVTGLKSSGRSPRSGPGSLQNGSSKFERKKNLNLLGKIEDFDEKI